MTTGDHRHPPSRDAQDISHAGWFAFAFFVIALVAAGIWSRSLFVGDTDLWYHLSGGRYLAQTGSIPTGSFFSFLEPAREYTNYYWLFQYLVYEVHDLLGYQGLAALRLLLTIAMLTGLAVLLAPDAHESNLGYVLRRLLFLIICVLLAIRYANLRPHCFSYLFTLAFLYILERKPKLLWLTPLLAVLWVNFHGITYPVLFIICLSYIADIYLKRARGVTGPADGTLNTALCLALSMGAVFATPHGSRLLAVPFRMTENITSYIVEMYKPQLADLVSFRFDWLIPLPATAGAVLLLLGAWALTACAVRRTLKLSHLLLLAGGFYLFTKAGRFINEFALLSTPLTLVWLKPAREDNDVEPTLWRYLIPLGMVVSLFLVATPGIKANPRPFSLSELPMGTLKFLKNEGGGGRVFNHPTPGGFLEWELYPDYKIFMDMQVPFLFTDADMFTQQAALNSADTLKRILNQYRPAYLLDTIEQPNYREEMEKLSEYRVVFLDDNSVLYADRRLIPRVVEKFEISQLPPYNLSTSSYETLKKSKNEEALLAELEKLHGAWPQGGMVNILLTQARSGRGEFDRALAHAASVVRDHPDRYSGYLLAGEIYRKMGKYDESLEALENGVENSADANRRRVFRALGLTHQQAGNEEKAYLNLRRGTLWGDPTLKAEDYWRLATAATLAGRPRSAVEAAQHADAILKESDKELAVTIRNFLDLMEAKPLLEAPSTPAPSPGTQTADAPRN